MARSSSAKNCIPMQTRKSVTGKMKTHVVLRLESTDVQQDKVKVPTL